MRREIKHNGRKRERAKEGEKKGGDIESEGRKETREGEIW